MKKLPLLLFLGMVSMLAFAQADSPAPPSDVTLTPTTYDWGVSARDYPYYEVFKVTNNRSTSIDITSISTDPPPPFSVVRSLTTCGGTLPAGQKCFIEVELLAGADGPKTGTLTVDCNVGACPLTSTLSATIVNDVKLSAPPASCDLSAYVGDTAYCQVTLTSYLPDNLGISGIDAAPDPPFSQTNNCHGSVGPYGSCSITVACTPEEPGLVSGSLTVTDNSPDGTPSPFAISCFGLEQHCGGGDCCLPSGCPQ
ncbi:MAG: choice-of-anchor D domain-containing protein [Candidatus Korobacteraceae bacterium]|jgi:hypothetical protein